MPTESIQMWHERRDAIKAGHIRAFNTKKWELDVDQIKTRKAERKERRDAKRARLGITTKFRRAQRPSLVDINAAERDHDGDNDDGALFEPEYMISDSSLFEHSDSHQLEPVAPSVGLSRPATILTNATTRTQSTTPQLKQTPGSAVPSSTKPFSIPKVPTKSLTAPAAKLTPNATARKSVNIFTKRWDDRTPARKRGPPAEKVADLGENEKDPKTKRPMTLSRLYKINKATANEPAPPSFEEMQAAYTHQSSGRSIVANDDAAPVADRNPATAEAPSNLNLLPHLRLQPYEQTCFFWADGRCFKTDDECPFAHCWLEHYREPAGRKGQVPRYWPESQRQKHPAASVPTAIRTAEQETVDNINQITSKPVNTSVTTIHARLTTHSFKHVDTELSTTSPALPALVMSTRGPNPQLAVNFALTDKGYAIFASSNPLISVSIHFGDVHFTNPTDDTRQYHARLKKQAVTLDCACTASVIVHKQWAMLLYPASKAGCFGDNEAGHREVSEEHLRFQIIAPLRATHDPPTVTIADENFGSKQETFVEFIYRQFAGIMSPDIEKLFEWFFGMSLARNVFLHFEGHPQERDLLTTLIGPAAEVSNSDQPGAWEKFVEKVNKVGGTKDRNGSGVVIFHPSHCKFNTMRHLSILLHSKVNFWIFGPCTDDRWQLYNTFEPIQIWKIFTNGTVVMIVDDLFENHPKRAYPVVQYIAKKGENVPWSKRTWKLFARPRLLKWLMALCVQHKADVKPGSENIRLHLHDTIWDGLCPPHMRIAPDLEDPDESATLIGDTPVGWAAFREIYKGRSLREQEVLNFAIWSLKKYFAFRRFVVVVPEVTAEYERYREEWRHLDIITPEKYVSRYSRG